ncbi:hypothetical protein ACFVFI_36680 [Streptomyces sp. NPDC057705]|uniref:hypothetical protein n=1 Tax=Streptomyces sp. NPDC057705 TaxID=3346222 RepID=UPI0036AD8500
MNNGPAPPVMAAAAVCGATDPQLVVRIEEQEYLAMPSAQFGPEPALCVALCRSRGGPYRYPWRRVLAVQPVWVGRRAVGAGATSTP